MKPEGDKRQLLLQHMHNEVVAARSMYMDGFMAQAGLHLFNGWHALACLQADANGEPYPGLSSLQLDPGSLPNADRVARDAEQWEASFKAVLGFSPTAPVQELLERMEAEEGQSSQERKRLATQIRYQLRMAEEAHKKLHWQDRVARMRVKAPGRRKIGIVAGVILAAGLIAAGVYFLPSSDEAAAPPAPGVQPSDNPAPPVPAGLALELDDLAQAKPQNTAWDAKGTHRFESFVMVDLGDLRRSKAIELSLDSNDDYLVHFFRSGQQVGTVQFQMRPNIPGLRVERQAVPAEAVAGGYDGVKVLVGPKGDGIYVLGHLLLHDEMPAPAAAGDAGSGAAAKAPAGAGDAAPKPPR